MEIFSVLICLLYRIHFAVSNYFASTGIWLALYFHPVGSLLLEACLS